MAISILEIVGIGATLFTSLGSSAAFIFRYGLKLSHVERTANEANAESKQNGKDIASLDTRVNLMESTLKDIRDSLNKLHGIDEIRSTVLLMKDTMTRKFEEMVPRKEHEARWQAQDDRFEALKEQIAELKQAD